MKSFINAIWSFLESVGQARAAASLARLGKIEEAKAIFSK